MLSSLLLNMQFFHRQLVGFYHFFFGFWLLCFVLCLASLVFYPSSLVYYSCSSDFYRSCFAFYYFLLFCFPVLSCFHDWFCYSFPFPFHFFFSYLFSSLDLRLSLFLKFLGFYHFPPLVHQVLWFVHLLDLLKLPVLRNLEGQEEMCFSCLQAGVQSDGVDVIEIGVDLPMYSALIPPH